VFFSVYEVRFMSIELYDIFLSLLRWGIGIVIGSAFGLVWALTSFSRTRAFQAMDSLLDFLRALPIIALVPVVQFWFGISEFGKIGLIAWTSFFPVWLQVRSALRRRDIELEVRMTAARLSRRDILYMYHVPRIIGGLNVGVSISIGICWISLVAAELVGTYNQGFWAGGLGYKLFLAFELNNWLTGSLALILFGALGAGTSFCWNNYLRQLLFVRRGFDPIKVYEYAD